MLHIMKYFSRLYFFYLICRKTPQSLSCISYCIRSVLPQQSEGDDCSRSVLPQQTEGDDCSRSVLPQQTEGDDCSCSASELFSFLFVCPLLNDTQFLFNPKYFGFFRSLSNCILVIRGFAIKLGECETQNNV